MSERMQHATLGLDARHRRVSERERLIGALPRIVDDPREDARREQVLDQLDAAAWAERTRPRRLHHPPRQPLYASC